MDEFQQDFKNADTDHDGYLTKDEFYELFLKYNPDFYVGFASDIIARINYDNKNPDRISLEQASEYYGAYRNNSCYLMEIKYGLLHEV